MLEPQINQKYLPGIEQNIECNFSCAICRNPFIFLSNAESIVQKSNKTTKSVNKYFKIDDDNVSLTEIIFTTKFVNK